MGSIRLRATGFAILGALFTFAGCQPNTPPAKPPPPKVTVRRPIEKDVVEYREYTGQLEAVERVEIRARVRGFLQKINFKEGTEVKAETVLYEIDPETFQAEVARAQAELERQEAQLKLAIREADRAGELRGSRAISPEEYQQRVATREATRGAMHQAQAALKSAQLELGYAQIRAPIDGRTSRTLVTEGNLVGYNEPTLLTTLVRMDPVYVYFEVAEREFLEYQQMIKKKGAPTAEQGKVPIFLELANESSFPHEGHIDFRDNRADPNTGTILLRGSLPNPERLLTPGLSVRARVPLGAPRKRLLVPEAALAADQRGQFLLVVKEDNTVEPRKVVPGQVTDGMLVIEKGITPEDRVVVNGLQRARPGSTVDPQEGETAAKGVTPGPQHVPTVAPPIGQPPAGPKNASGQQS